MTTGILHEPVLLKKRKVCIILIYFKLKLFVSCGESMLSFIFGGGGGGGGGKEAETLFKFLV